MGLEGPRLEMLFLSPAERGAGLGRQLLEYGIRHYHLQELTVNEQNPQAVGFYQHMGFETYRRTDCDEQGGPYPLLYMKRVCFFHRKPGVTNASRRVRLLFFCNYLMSV